MTELTLTIEIGPARHPTDEAEGSLNDSPLEAITLLADPDSRAILSAMAREYRTVLDVATVSEVPISTVYRKVRKLVAAGLLSERVQLRADGHHPIEYRVRPATFEVTLPGRTASGPARPPDRRRAAADSLRVRRAMRKRLELRTDGNGVQLSECAPASESRPVHHLLVDVSGFENVVAELDALDSDPGARSDDHDALEPPREYTDGR